MQPLERAQLYVFEGPDGVGKTTLVRETQTYLDDHGYSTVRYGFPGNRKGSLGELIYEVHHGHILDEEDLLPLSLQVLHVAAHIDCIEKDIKPTLRAGKSVLLDRFWWSTWVYGRVAGIAADDMDQLINIEQRVWGNLEPATLFLIDRDKPFRAEHTTETHRLISRLYEELANRNPPFPVVRLENIRSTSELASDIGSVILSALNPN